MNESIVTKTTITVPVNGVAVAAVSTIETVPYWTRSRKRSGKNEYLFNTFCELEGFFFSLIEFRCDVSDMWVQLLQVGRIRLLLTIQRLLVRLQVHQTSLPSSKLQRLKKEKSTTSSLKQYVC